MVTAEAAMVLPVLVALTAALAWVVALGVVQVRLVDTAREAARLAARSEPVAQVQQAAMAAAPDGSRLRLHRDGDTWVAEVTVEVGPNCRWSAPWLPSACRRVPCRPWSRLTPAIS
jgi:hypothetical protein